MRALVRLAPAPLFSFALSLALVLAGCQSLPGPISGPAIQVTYEGSGKHRHRVYWKDGQRVDSGRLVEAMAGDPEAQDEARAARRFQIGTLASLLLGVVSEGVSLGAVIACPGCGAPGPDGKRTSSEETFSIMTVGGIGLVFGGIGALVLSTHASNHRDLALALYNMHVGTPK